MSLLRDEEDATFSLREPAAFGNPDQWTSKDCLLGGSDEMLNLLENEEEEEEEEEEALLTPDPIEDRANGVGSCRGLRCTDEVVAHWTAMRALCKPQRQQSISTELDLDETAKCVISSVLFVIVIFLLIVMIFVWNPSV